MSEYYTPSIEEFYVGFEYESLQDERQPEDDSSWDKLSIDSVFDLKNFANYYYQDSIAGLRVKYLDKEDIESLGFAVIQKDLDSWDEGEYWVEKDHITIFTYFDDIEDLKDGYPTLIVEGGSPLRIKNKSELKIALNMLGITFDNSK